MDRAWSWYRRDTAGSITITTTTIITIYHSTAIDRRCDMRSRVRVNAVESTRIAANRSCFFAALFLAGLLLGGAMQMAIGAVEHGVG